MAVLAGILACAADASAVRERLRPLTGTVPRALARMAPAGRAPADVRLGHVIVVLGLRDGRGLDAVIAAQQDRRTPRYRRWLDAEEIADRFGPRRADYEAVRRFFEERGLTIKRDSPYRESLVVTGTARQIEAALGTQIGLFRAEGRTYRGPLAEPVLPAHLAASVRGIIGLDDLPKFRPLVRVGERTALGPTEFAQAYGVGPLREAGVTGAGRTIAVVARSNFLDSDVHDFAERFVGAPPRFRRLLVDERLDPGILPGQGEEIEVLLDTQWAGALAPGAHVNVVISTLDGDIPESLAAAIVGQHGDIISISFGVCEAVGIPLAVAELFDALYAIANAQGQTVVVAAGDAGSRDCLPTTDEISVNALASSPHAIAIGGTSFSLASDGTLPGAPEEWVWDDFFGAGGGGESVFFAPPRYQQAIGLGFSGRAIPDLSLAASPDTPGYVIVQRGLELVVGGTSAGVPAMASMLALVAERLSQTEGTGRLGQLLPQLYRFGSEQTRGLRERVFRDVVVGDNDPGLGTISFAAGPGFDLASGWGTPIADALAAAVGSPGRCEPAVGCLVPARGRRRRACIGEWLVEQSVFATRGELPHSEQTCRDGDPQCDVDGTADGRCTINVALCVNAIDFRLVRSTRRGTTLACRPTRVRAIRLRSPRSRTPLDSANRAALDDALGALPALPTDLANACTATVPVVVPVAGPEGPGRTRLRARILHVRGATNPRVTLRCVAA
jgi:kumamolisin